MIFYFLLFKTNFKFNYILIIFFPSPKSFQIISHNLKLFLKKQNPNRTTKAPKIQNKATPEREKKSSNCNQIKEAVDQHVIRVHKFLSICN